MIAYLAGWTEKKDSVFRAIGAVAGGAARLAVIGVSARGFPETTARAAEAMRLAKKKPKARVGRVLKYALIRGQYNWSRRYFTRHPDRVAVCWNGLTGSRRAFMEGARDAGAARLFVELAPFPGRITIDPKGVNAWNSLPRDPQAYRDWAAADPARRGEGWRALGDGLIARASRRVDVGQAGAEGLAQAGHFLFVPLQVPNDSQITIFAGWVRSVEGMLDALASAAPALPEGWHLRIKEHPSARASLAEPLARAVAQAGGRIVVDNATDTFAQVAASAGVITINSSVGLQAFFHDKPVIVLGEAFFSLPGLVTVADSPEALHATLSAPESLTYDPGLRAAFMSYLDQVYYPRTQTGADGTLVVDPQAIEAKLQEARHAAGR